MSRSTCRLRKIECSTCGAILYGSATAIRSAGLPVCGCGGGFGVAKLRDLEIIDPDAFDLALATMPAAERTEALRALGYQGAIHRNAGTLAQQCSEVGCYYRKAKGSALCRRCGERETVPF